MATEVSMDWAMAMELSVAMATTTEALMVWAMALAVEVAASTDWAIMALEAMDMVLTMETTDMVATIPHLLEAMASPASTKDYSLDHWIPLVFTTLLNSQ